MGAAEPPCAATLSPKVKIKCEELCSGRSRAGLPFRDRKIAKKKNNNNNN